MTAGRPERGSRRAGRGWLPALLTLALAAAAPLAGWQLRERAAPVAFVEEIAVAAAETPVTIGWRKLGQHPGARSAAAEHLHVARREGQWLIANAARDRRVLARTDRVESRYLQRWRLAPGDRILLPGGTLAVEEADGRGLTIADPATGRRVRFTDGKLAPAGEPVHQVCRSGWRRLVDRARWWFREVAASARPELPLFTIGGNVNCSNRWRHGNLPPRALAVAWHAGAFLLAPGSRRQDVLLARAGGGPPRAFTELALPLDGPEGRVERIILGRTSYRLEPGERALRLVPAGNVDFWFAEAPEGAVRHLAWAGAGAGPLAWLEAQSWRLLPGLAPGLAAALALFLFWRRRRRLGAAWFLGGALALAVGFCGIWLTLLLRSGAGGPDAMLPVGMAWLAWAWASLVLLVSGRLKGLGGWIWLAAFFLAGAGLLALLQLGAGAENSRWMSFALKHAALLALFGWTLSMMAIVPDRAWRRLWLWLLGSEALAAALAALLVLLMLAQLALGSEEGIAGVQPVEATKTVFVLLLAFAGMHLIEIRQRETRAYRRSPLAFLLPFLRFIGIFLVVILSVVVGVRDFSPMIIIGLVLLAWLWKVGSSQRGERTGAGLWALLRPGVAVAALLVLGAGLWAHNNAEALPADMPQKDRVLVWAEPALHPHSGAQVLASLDRVGEGGWTGAVAWFGPNGRVMGLPAVQDDFITAFFLYRFGGLAGLALLAAQLLYLWCLFLLARAVERRAAEGDFRLQSAGRVLGFALFGLAFMHIAHWTIAWSNTLGLLPVMGQPMTWLSAGNSHLLGFAMATLALALVTAWVRPTLDER